MAIKLLLDEVFVISGIIKVEVGVVSPAAVFWDVTQRSPRFFGGALRDIQKTAAEETKVGVISRSHKNGI